MAHQKPFPHPTILHIQHFNTEHCNCTIDFFFFFKWLIELRYYIKKKKKEKKRGQLNYWIQIKFHKPNA